MSDAWQWFGWAMLQNRKGELRRALRAEEDPEARAELHQMIAAIEEHAPAIRLPDEFIVRERP